LRVIYYTHPAFLASALHFARAMGQLVELHLLVELSPGAWRTALFDVAPEALPAGIVPAAPLLEGAFPPGVKAYWSSTRSQHFVVHGSSKSINPGSWRIGHQVTSFIHQLKPDVVHFDAVPRRLLLNLPELGGLPLVLSVHDPELHGGEQNWRTELVRRILFPRIRRFILHNQSSTSGFCDRYGVSPDRVATVLMGVHDISREWITSDIQPEERTILFFGRQSAYKGLEVLYKAAPRVAAELADVRFIVAGTCAPGYAPPAPPQLCNGGRIDVVDEYVSNTRAAELFQKATLVVCPYTDATQSAVVLTAFAFGKPVVATKVGGLPEYVHHNRTGLLVPANDSEALASALLRLLGEPLLRQRLTHELTAMRDEFSWDNSAHKTRAIYAAAAPTSA
jgi:glycosyltransferase involved in cell wall biosynthesis